EGPVAQFEGEEQKQLLASAINRLGEREKMVLVLYYYESFTLARIGEILGVTESRVCQIHTKAVLQLRAKLADRPEAAGRRPEASKAKSSVGPGAVGHGTVGKVAGVTAPKRVPTTAAG